MPKSRIFNVANMYFLTLFVKIRFSRTFLNLQYLVYAVREALASQHICTGSPEPPLLTDVIRTKILCAGAYGWETPGLCSN